jgi:uncharacterized protein YueI
MEILVILNMVDVFHEYHQFHGQLKDQHFREIKVCLFIFNEYYSKRKIILILELAKIIDREEKIISELNSPSNVNMYIICPDAISNKENLIKNSIN